MVGAPMFRVHTICMCKRATRLEFHLRTHLFALRQLLFFFVFFRQPLSSLSAVYRIFSYCRWIEMVFFPSDTVLALLLLLCSVLILGVIFIMGIQMGHPFRLRRADHAIRMLFLVGFGSRAGCMCLCVQFFNKGLIYLSGRYPVDLCF